MLRRRQRSPQLCWHPLQLRSDRGPGAAHPGQHLVCRDGNGVDFYCDGYVGFLQLRHCPDKIGILNAFVAGNAPNPAPTSTTAPGSAAVRVTLEGLVASLASLASLVSQVAAMHAKCVASLVATQTALAATQADLAQAHVGNDGGQLYSAMQRRCMCQPAPGTVRTAGCSNRRGQLGRCARGHARSSRRLQHRRAAFSAPAPTPANSHGSQSVLPPSACGRRVAEAPSPRTAPASRTVTTSGAGTSPFLRRRQRGRSARGPVHRRDRRRLGAKRQRRRPDLALGPPRCRDVRRRNRSGAAPPASPPCRRGPPLQRRGPLHVHRGRGPCTTQHGDSYHRPSLGGVAQHMHGG